MGNGVDTFTKWPMVRVAMILAGLALMGLALYRMLPPLLDPPPDDAELIELLGEDYQAAYIIPVAETIPPAPTATISSNPLETPAPTDAAPAEVVEKATPEPRYPPTRLVIPRIELDAPVEETGSRQIKIRDTVYEQWLVPDKFAAGWNPNSAYPGVVGNTVLFGHNNARGKVFANLYRLEVGDEIILYSSSETFTYRVTDVMKLQEKDVSFAQMVENATWIGSFPDERLTLVTCWPPYKDTHRLIVVARPVAPPTEKEQ